MALLFKKRGKKSFDGGITMLSNSTAPSPLKRQQYLYHYLLQPAVQKKRDRGNLYLLCHCVIYS